MALRWANQNAYNLSLSHGDRLSCTISSQSRTLSNEVSKEKFRTSNGITAHPVGSHKWSPIISSRKIFICDEIIIVYLYTIHWGLTLYRIRPCTKTIKKTLIRDYHAWTTKWLFNATKWSAMKYQGAEIIGTVPSQQLSHHIYQRTLWNKYTSSILWVKEWTNCTPAGVTRLRMKVYSYCGNQEIVFNTYYK